MSGDIELNPGPPSSGSGSMDPPGFRRVDVVGKRICYLSIPDPGKKEETHRALYNIAQVKEYLKGNGLEEAKMMEALQQFDFSKRKCPESLDDGRIR